MESLLVSAGRALRSLFAPGMFSVMLVSVVFTIFALFGFVTLSTLLFHSLAGGLGGWLGGIAASAIAWFLFPGIMPVIVSFFDNRIVALIENHDYPADAPAHMPDFWPELWHDVRFSFVVIALNIVLLPLYLLPLVNLFIFYLLNGYLLGREFFVMVGRRHMPAKQAEILRKRHSGLVTLCGVALTLCATIPIVNFFAPFWGIALMTHLYHSLNVTPRSEILLPK